MEDTCAYMLLCNCFVTFAGGFHVSIAAPSSERKQLVYYSLQSTCICDLLSLLSIRHKCRMIYDVHLADVHPSMHSSFQFTQIWAYMCKFLNSTVSFTDVLRHAVAHLPSFSHSYTCPPCRLAHSLRTYL